MFLSISLLPSFASLRSLFFIAINKLPCSQWFWAVLYHHFHCENAFVLLVRLFFPIITWEFAHFLSNHRACLLRFYCFYCPASKLNFCSTFSKILPYFSALVFFLRWILQFVDEKCRRGSIAKVEIIWPDCFFHYGFPKLDIQLFYSSSELFSFYSFQRSSVPNDIVRAIPRCHVP